MSLQLPLPVGLFQADRSTRDGQSNHIRSTSFELARRFSGRIELLDGSLSAEEIAETIRGRVQELL